MADCTAKRIEEMDGLHRGAIRKVRAESGLTSLGVRTIVGGVRGRALTAKDVTELGARDPADNR